MLLIIIILDISEKREFKNFFSVAERKTRIKRGRNCSLSEVEMSGSVCGVSAPFDSAQGARMLK